MRFPGSGVSCGLPGALQYEVQAPLPCFPTGARLLQVGGRVVFVLRVV